MDKPTLFFDLDESLVDTAPLTRRYVFDRYDVCLPDGYIDGHLLHEFVNARLPADRQIDRTVFWNDHRIHFQMSRKMQRQLKPVAGADEVVQQLARKYVLWLTTARSQNSMSIIREVLEDLFPGAFTGIHCVWHYHNNGRLVERPKHAEMARCAPEHRVAFIDNHPMEIRRASSVVRAYLFDPNHWHTGETDIEHRVHSWEEIGALLL